MNRLGSTVLVDVRLQFRNGFYWAAGFVAVFWVALLQQFPAEPLRWLMPVFLISNIMVGTFYLMAGLVFLEKGEGTLAAQVVTPLRDWEYLASKILSLSGLALVESYLIARLGGFSPDVLPFLLGIGSAAAILTLCGFIFVSRYTSVNEFLFPSFLLVIVFAPPFLHYLGLLESSLNYLHPIQPPLILATQAFSPGPSWRWVYGTAGSVFWIGVILQVALRCYRRFVVAAEGGSA